MSHASAITRPGESLTMEKMLDAIDKVKFPRPGDDWFLIDPQGHIRKGTYQQVLNYLVAQHPLLKQQLP